MFKVDIVGKHLPRTSSIKQFYQNTRPTTCVNVRGDGNCFYRVLSLAVSGTEAHYDTIRQQLVAFMMSDVIDRQLHELYPTLMLESVACDGEWASDAEIFAAAAYLETDIFVHTDHGWHVYDVQTLGRQQQGDKNLYIKNARSHFYFVKGI